MDDIYAKAARLADIPDDMGVEMMADAQADLRARREEYYRKFPENNRPVQYTQNIHSFNAGLFAVLLAETRVLKEEIQILSSRLKHAEGRLAKGTLKYEGTWDETAPYERGATVTSNGSLWVAVADAPAGVKPGAADYQWPKFWQLAVRAGRNGRDADGVRRST